MDAPVVLEFKDGVQFPRLCARCNVPASRTLPIQKLFESDEHKTIHWIEPYFCDACIAEHRRLVPAPSIAEQLGALLLTWNIIPVLISAPAAVWLGFKLSQAVLRGDRASAIFFIIFFVVAVLGLLAYGQAARSQARPKLIEKQSPITQAVVFTHDLSKTFEPTYRQYTFQNAAYAEQVRTLNARLIWDRHGNEANRAFTLRFYGQWLLYAALAVLAAYWIYDDYLRELINSW